MYATTKVAKMNILNPTSASIIKRRLFSSSIPINGNVFLSRNFYNNNMRRLRATKLLPTSQKLVQNRQFTLKRQNSYSYQEELSGDLKMVLSSIGSTKEVQYWLKHYGNSGKKEIAVIKIGGAILRDEELLNTLINSVSFLHPTRVPGDHFWVLFCGETVIFHLATNF